MFKIIALIAVLSAGDPQPVGRLSASVPPFSTKEACEAFLESDKGVELKSELGKMLSKLSEAKSQKFGAAVQCMKSDEKPEDDGSI